MSVSITSFILALVTLLGRVFDFMNLRNKNANTLNNKTLRNAKRDLEHLLRAIKIRRKIKNAYKKTEIIRNINGVDAVNKLRKPFDQYQIKKYQRDE